MKAVILARVSTEEQREAGNSLPAQVHRLEEYCQRKGFELLKTYSFDESAYKLKRDEFDKAMDFIKESKEKIVVCFDKVDRFTRNIFDKRVPVLYELAMQDRIELHFSSDNLVITSNISAVEKFHFGTNINLAKYFSDAISDNTKRALEQMRRNGEWPGSARIGYIKDTEGTRVDAEKADLIQKMFELYSTGNYSIKTLQAEMKRLRLKSKNGKYLAPSMIYKVLTDKFYIGIMTSNGREYPHKYPHIIARELFDRVQGIMASYQKKTVKYASKPFILRGLVHCEKCGCTVTAEIKKGKYIYYSCSNFKGGCTRVWIPEADLLKPIKDILQSLQMDQSRIDQIVSKLKEINENKNEFHEKMVRLLQAEYNKIQENTNRLLDLRIDGSITQDIYDKKLSEFKEKQYDINIRMEEYTRADQNFHIVANTVLSLANRALDIFESSEVDEKRQLLNFLLQNCRLSGKNLAFELRSPFGMILEQKHHPSVLASPV